jgi:poly-D-alanine transfer protein DltD
VITKPPSTAESSWKIPKSKEAGPGSYDEIKSYEMTQRKKVSMSKTTDKRVGFTEAIAKLNKYKPDPAKYKEIDRGLKICGR